MPLRSSAYLLLAVACLDVAPAAGKVLLRVEAGPLPPAKPWESAKSSCTGRFATPLAWRNYAPWALAYSCRLVRTILKPLPTAAENANLAGVIVDRTNSAAATNDEALRSTKAAHPKLIFRSLISGG